MATAMKIGKTSKYVHSGHLIGLKFWIFLMNIMSAIHARVKTEEYPDALTGEKLFNNNAA